MAKKSKKTKEVADIHSIKECPDCASVNIVYNEERQQVICRDCGLIYEPLAPEMEKRFEESHELVPREAHEKIMIGPVAEKPVKAKPRKVKKPRKAKKKKKVRKKAKKPRKKAVKKKPVKKKKPVREKAKPKKKAVKKKPVKKKGFLGRIKARLKKKR